MSPRTEALLAAADALGLAADALRRAARSEAAEGPPRLMSVEEAADALGLGRTATYGLIQSGSLRTHKIGRRRLVSEAAVADYIAAGSSGGPA
jgi:excisionase family DNA binding protein